MKQLYESIMKDVSKIVKKHLNETDNEMYDNEMSYNFSKYITVEFKWNGITYIETCDVYNDLIHLENESFWECDKYSSDKTFDFEICGTKDENGNLLMDDIWVEVYKYGESDIIKYIYDVNVIDFE